MLMIAGTEKLLVVKINKWKTGMEEKGLLMNMGNTEVMRCENGGGKVEIMGRFSFEICKKRYGLSLSRVIHSAYNS